MNNNSDAITQLRIFDFRVVEDFMCDYSNNNA